MSAEFRLGRKYSARGSCIRDSLLGLMRYAGISKLIVYLINEQEEVSTARAASEQVV